MGHDVTILDLIHSAHNGHAERHPKCAGVKIDRGPDGYDYDCEYNTTITCDECKYCAGRKDPEAKVNQQR